MWLEQLHDGPNDEFRPRLVDELDQGIAHDEAVEHLSVVLETIMENYAEYRDYNSTTTQSDCGDLLYTFFDFLRLRIEYDRISWNLRPVAMAHEILIRHGFNTDAEVWRV